MIFRRVGRAERNPPNPRKWWVSLSLTGPLLLTIFDLCITMSGFTSYPENPENPENPDSDRL